MKTRGRRQQGFGCLLCLLICHMAGSAVARPRPPWPPYPELRVLCSFRFDQAGLFASQNTALLAHNLALVESWSGYALTLEGQEPRLFVVPAVDGNGRTNLSTVAGTIRFWFRPSWSSLPLGGKGPGTEARLFEVGAWTDKRSVGWWSLQLSEGGEILTFVAESQGQCLEILRAPIQWREGEWRQVAFSYSPQGSWLFLDGQFAAEGPPVALLPLDKTPGVLGLCLGSDARGANLAQGHFDELTLFGAPQDGSQVAWSYSRQAGLAALGPVTPEEDAARLARIAAARADSLVASQVTMTLDGPPTPPGGGGGTNGPPSTNSWAWASGFDHGTNLGFWSVGYVATNLTTNVYLALTNHVAGNSHDLYLSTNLAPVSFWSGTTQGIAWSFVTNLAAGYGSLTLSNLAAPEGFFAVAAHGDSDLDGLWDGDERFLWKTDPANPDSDGDGLPDGWCLLYGLNPLGNAADDPCAAGDGMTNLEKYLAGQRPDVKTSVQVFAAEPKATSIIP